MREILGAKCFNWSRRLALFGFLLAVAAVPLSAETIISSLSTSPFGFITTLRPVFWLASAFQTDQRYWNLDAVSLELAGGPVRPGYGVGASVHLFSDLGGKPGFPLADLGSQLITNWYGDVYTFTASRPTTLNPSTRYWVVMGGFCTNQSISFATDTLSSETIQGVPGASMGPGLCEGIIDTNAPASEPPSTWGDSGPEALLFQVDGTVRPQLSLIVSNGTTLAVQFPSEPALQYVLQAALSLEPASLWTNLSTNTGTGGLLSIPVVVDALSAPRFFRLQVVQ